MQAQSTTPKAAAVPFEPAGDLTATNVQDAIVQAAGGAYTPLALVAGTAEGGLSSVDWLTRLDDPSYREIILQAGPDGADIIVIAETTNRFATVVADNDSATLRAAVGGAGDIRLRVTAANGPELYMNSGDSTLLVTGFDTAASSATATLNIDGTDCVVTKALQLKIGDTVGYVPWAEPGAAPAQFASQHLSIDYSAIAEASVTIPGTALRSVTIMTAFPGWTGVRSTLAALDLSACTLLDTLLVYRTDGQPFTITIPETTTLTNLNLTISGMSQADADAYLTTLDAAGAENGAVYVWAVPSSTGLDAITSLTGKGWTCSYD